MKEDREPAALSFEKRKKKKKKKKREKWWLKADRLSSSEQKGEGVSAVGGKPWRAGRDSERRQREKGERKMEREEKQGTYFPVYPNLRDAKRLKTGAGGTQRDRKKEGRGGNKS